DSFRGGSFPLHFGIAQHAQEVLAVLALARLLAELLELRRVDEALEKRDLLDTGDLQALALFERLDELRAAQERIIRAGVEPGDAAAHGLDGKLAAREVRAIDVGDFKLAARRGLEVLRRLHD